METRSPCMFFERNPLKSFDKTCVTINFNTRKKVNDFNSDALLHTYQSNYTF